MNKQELINPLVWAMNHFTDDETTRIMGGLINKSVYYDILTYFTQLYI